MVHDKNQYFWPRLDVSMKYALPAESSEFHLRVYLVSENFEVCNKFVLEEKVETYKKWHDTFHTIDVTSNARYILFGVGGKNETKTANASLILRKYGT